MSGGPVPVWKKYTTQSKGIWEKIRQFLVLVPNRSSGNPVVPLYRVPARGDNEQFSNYHDPVTLPAADIQKNLYFKRDSRRNFPQPITITQSKLTNLIQFGSAAESKLLKGSKGELQLTEKSDLITELKKNNVNGLILGTEGEPIMAPNLGNGKAKLVMVQNSGVVEDGYPCRIFNYQ